MRIGNLRFVFVCVAIAYASAVSAHVIVSPRVSNTNAHEKYTVRVPTEGKVATTSVELVIPSNVTFVSIGVATAHTYELKRSEGRVVGIIWSMKIGPGEFAEFTFMARNSKDGKEIVWKAIQQFADGSSTQWVESPGSKHPASITTLSVGDVRHAH